MNEYTPLPVRSLAELHQADRLIAMSAEIARLKIVLQRIADAPTLNRWQHDQASLFKDMARVALTLPTPTPPAGEPDHGQPSGEAVRGASEQQQASGNS